MERLIKAQHPPRSDFARCFRTYLKYKCSRKRRRAANSIPAIKSRKADKNCSNANGSELLCSCLPEIL